MTFNVPESGEERREIVVPENTDSSLAAYSWAFLRLAELERQRKINRRKIKRLGQQFHIPTPETSLIVLDDVADYARYAIEPPPELLSQYEELLMQARAGEDMKNQGHMEAVVRLFKAREEWWQKVFPKDDIPKETTPSPPPGFRCGS